MEPDLKRTYISLRLERAQEDIASAWDDHAHGHDRAAANRAYYAIFHTASAALLWLGIERVRHSGVQSAFSQYLVKPGVIEPEFGVIFSEARKLREQQDYDLEAVPLEVDEARDLIDSAARFVERMNLYLAEVGFTPDLEVSDEEPSEE